MTADLAMIQQTLAVLRAADAVAELRVLHTGRTGTVSGYYDDIEVMAQAAAKWSGKAPGVYVTLNPCTPALLARSANRLTERAQQTTSDSDIVQRCWFPIDFDPVRPAGISSTDAEHDAALQRARQCYAWLKQRGWPEPLAADSGNGAHLLYRVDLPNDTTSRDLLKRGLEAVALYHGDDVVRVDLTTFNAARIWKLYGTLACKGDNLQERPHRLARLLKVPTSLEVVSHAQLEALAALVPEPPKTTPRPGHNGYESFDLEQWIAEHGLPVGSQGAWNGGTKWVLNPCPWERAHTNKAAFIVQFANGAIAAGCHHNGCSGNDWHALRDLYEPGWRAYRDNPPQLRVNGQAPPPAVAMSGQGSASQGSVWEKAIPVGDFLAQEDTTRPALAQDLVVPGAITIVAAPRGTGKSVTALALGIALASGGIFRGEMLPSTRVLLVDRDNPPVVVRKRLGWLGAIAGYTLDILTRDDAPPLKDKTAWASFPVDKYAVVIIDSLGAATEGVSEKEGRQTQEFLATLKDLAHRGPAILALDNTNKAATSYRGRGEKADAVDILYEARDITGWTPSTADAWWESLPEYGDHAWQQRATRRKGQKVLRIAFIPSKFRLGIEPEPFAIEIDTTTTPWTLADITEHIATAGTRAAEETRHQARQKVEHAALTLVHALTARSADAPMLKEEAVTLLRGCGLTNKAARTLLELGGNREVYPQGQWIIRPVPGHRSGKALGVYPVCEENGVERSNVIIFPRQYTSTGQPPSYTGSAPSVERSELFLSSNGADLNGADLSTQPDNNTSKGVMAPDEQPCGDSADGGPFYAPTHSDAVSADGIPEEVF